MVAGLIQPIPKTPWPDIELGRLQPVFTTKAKPCKKNVNGALLGDKVLFFLDLLRDCSRNKDLCRGICIHDDILQNGLLHKCSDALITMYAKSGALDKARELLEVHGSKNVFSWNAVIAGYAKQGQAQNALNCFEWMKWKGPSPNTGTFACILKACGIVRTADKGAEIHDYIQREGLLQKDIVLGTALVDMYAKCGALAKAREVLEQLSDRNVFSWTALIAGYVEHGCSKDALICFGRMQQEGVSPDTVTFTCVLRACASIRALGKGEQLHEEIARQGLVGKHIVLDTALVDMYAKCNALVKAQWLLEELPLRNIATWNALIAGYAQHGEGEEALNCFEKVQNEGLFPNAVTFACILQAIGSIGAVDKGEKIHDEISKQGLLRNNVVLGNALVDMYAKCGTLAKAAEVLKELPTRNVISWSALIAGYAENGKGQQALDCFEDMKREGLLPNAVTFGCALKACGNIGAADKGDQIYDEIVKQGLLDNNRVLGLALVDMYAKCVAPTKAHRLLEQLLIRDVVSWNAVIAGYAEQEQGDQALECFEQMQDDGLSPDIVTFACILKACSSIGSADKGLHIHHEIVRQGLLRNNVVLGTALVNLYAKCGALAKAEQVLKELSSRDATSWNALITGYAHHECSEQALRCLEQMKQEGFSPDLFTFSSVLNACSHLAQLDNGQNYFVNMTTDYGMRAGIEHYTCLVDLYGRAGHLDKAVRLIQEMPLPDYCAVWSALLGACRKSGGADVGKWAFEHALEVDEKNSAAYALFTDIIAAGGMKEGAASLQATTAHNKT